MSWCRTSLKKLELRLRQFGGKILLLDCAPEGFQSLPHLWQPRQNHGIRLRRRQRSHFHVQSFKAPCRLQLHHQVPQLLLCNLLRFGFHLQSINIFFLALAGCQSTRSARELRTCRCALKICQCFFENQLAGAGKMYQRLRHGTIVPLIPAAKPRPKDA